MVLDLLKLLLAKKWCQLMTKETSLLARLMKSKYHLHGPLWEARKGYRQSFTWTSIWEAKWILEEGCVWSIGDGRFADVNV